VRIGIDVDGVLSDTLVSIHRKFPGWDTSKGWYGGFTKEQFDAVWEDAKNQKGFWLKIPAVKGLNYTNFSKLNALHDLYFITDRFDTVGGSAVKQTLTWIMVTLGLGAPAGVVVAKNKGPVACVLKLDYFIDDKPENCYAVYKAVPECKVYLCTLPHNVSHADAPFLPRVADFNEFAEMILEENQCLKAQ
jgi:5'(3')-deoxyribonucleotidase